MADEHASDVDWNQVVPTALTEGDDPRLIPQFTTDSARGWLKGVLKPEYWPDRWHDDECQPC